MKRRAATEAEKAAKPKRARHNCADADQGQFSARQLRKVCMCCEAPAVRNSLCVRCDNWVAHRIDLACGKAKRRALKAVGSAK